MKIGVALSGGGIRGIAHAGALKAFAENGINIDIIGGTSSGSLVAVLYAMGYTPYYIYMLFKRYAQELITVDTTPIINTVSSFITNKKNQVYGFNTGEAIEKAYNEIAKRKGIKYISDIKMPIAIPAVDVKTSKEYVFTNNKSKSRYISDIPVGTAVRASSSFPGVFCPCIYKEYTFLDGGILDNIPVNEVKRLGADKVIAINFKADDIDETSNFMDISMRTLDIMGNKISEESLQNSDFILTIKTDKTGLLDINKIDSCYKYGYKSAIKNLSKIKSILKY